MRPQLRFFFPCAPARFAVPFLRWGDEAVRVLVRVAGRGAAPVRALPPLCGRGEVGVEEEGECALAAIPRSVALRR